MKLLRLSALALILFFSLIGCGGESHKFESSARVDAQRLLAADQESGQWMSTGRTYDEQRFSPLALIHDGNVGELALESYYDIPTQLGQESTPIVVDGIMYISTDWSVVSAHDARTGELLWRFDPDVKSALVKSCCGPNNRGVAVWEGKVFVGVLDGRLIALDATNGKPVWETLTVDPDKAYTITGAPRVVKGLVVIGNGGGEFGVRGYVSAYNVNTGEQVWRFYTVPAQPGKSDGEVSDPVLEQLAAPTWHGEFWVHGGGGTVWDSMAYDPALDLLYIGVGNGGPWNQGVRSDGKGDNLFLASIVALRATTGEYVWHYQTTPGETWDFNATQSMILAEVENEGQLRQVLMQAPKNGYFYVIDRETGELLSATAFVPMTWSTGVDMATGRPVENPAARFYETGEPFLLTPSGLGAHSWQPMSFSPETGLAYIPVQQLPVIYKDNSDEPRGDKKFNLNVSFSFVTPPKELAIGGWLAAWDPVLAKEVWRVPYPGPVNGGTLVTAGNLVFQGSGQGEFLAYDASSGKSLWRFDAGTGIVAAPITYTVEGDQYVALMAGWGGNLAFLGGAKFGVSGKNRLLIFKLNGSAILPAKTVVTDLKYGN